MDEPTNEPMEQHDPMVSRPLESEPECIKRWRTEFENRIKVKDANETKKLAVMEEEGLKDLHNWAMQYRECLSRSIKESREHEKELRAQQEATIKASALACGTDFTQSNYWARVCQLCNFPSQNLDDTNEVAYTAPSSGKVSAKDLSRMRVLLLQLKQNPPTPRRNI